MKHRRDKELDNIESAGDIALRVSKLKEIVKEIANESEGKVALITHGFIIEFMTQDVKQPLPLYNRHTGQYDVVINLRNDEFLPLD